MADIVITAEAVSKYFPKTGRVGLRSLLTGLRPDERFTALEDVNLRVPMGEVTGILGRNGAGKSTLLRLMGGIYAPDRGRVALGGDVAGLFELGGFGNTQLTGRQFAERYMQLFGVPGPAWPDVLHDIEEFSELGEYFDQPIRTYSAGMGARLYFSTATAIPHEIYLIDEILSVGDEHFQAKSWARMRDRLAGGASGLLVTHDWSAVIKLCRRSMILASGRVAAEGPSDLVVAQYLDLPVPPGHRARLCVQPGQEFDAIGGRALSLPLEVELVEPGDVELAVSIEALQLGVGWEPAVLSEFAAVASTPGRYRVLFEVDSLPLATGEYSLNIFLSTAPDGQTGLRQSLDARSWTHGNGLVLKVAGDPMDCLTPFPVRWAEEEQVS